MQPDQYAVILPCEADRFSEFISGLLGKPQTITGRIYFPFQVNSDDVRNLFELIDQRVSQQNESSLIQFLITILYDDGSSVTMRSIENFLSYNEVKPLVSVGLNLSWTYLVKFRDKQAPEKQSIDVFFSTTRLNIGSGLLSYEEVDKDSGFRIEHTARTWGADIENLLAGHLRNFRRTDIPSIRNWARRHSEKIGTASGLALFLSSVAATIYSYLSFSASQTASVQKVQDIAFSAGADQKLNFILGQLAEGAWPRFLFGASIFIVCSAIASLFIGIFISEKAFNHPASFIVLTKRSELRMQLEREMEKKKWITLIVALVADVAIGIISNILFSRFFS